jgi:alanyl-tRNA synthetase
MAIQREQGATKFLGYETTSQEKVLIAFARPTLIVAGLPGSPFYAEAGGQIGDAGTISNDQFEFRVSDTKKTPEGTIVHYGEFVRGDETVAKGNLATFVVDSERRDAIRANHSATHLLHLALKEVLGEHVAQKGSLVAPDRLRFDFSHFAPMTDEEKRAVEDRVNSEIRKNEASQIEVLPFDEAKKRGAVALFGEKYGAEVRVMRIGRRSIELCGGTHVRRAGDIGLFKITSEVGIAQGVRRIEAVTGEGALGYLRKLESQLQATAERLRGSPFEVAARVERLQKELREREREVEELKKKVALGSGGARDLLAQARDVGGVKVLSTRTDVGDPKALREVADQLRSKLKSGIVVVGGVADGKVALVAAVSADLTSRYNAGKIVAAVSGAVGGKGGGRPDMAQGGGTEPDKLDAALEKVYELL